MAVGQRNEQVVLFYLGDEIIFGRIFGLSQHTLDGGGQPASAKLAASY